MDLNELLDAHQRAVMQAHADGCPRGEQAIRVALYAARIRKLRDRQGDADHAASGLDADTVVYAGRSGTDAMPLGMKALESWETEGGALSSLPAALPDGITMTLRPEYQVGAYTYSDLAHALAEHARQQRAVDGSATDRA